MVAAVGSGSDDLEDLEEALSQLDVNKKSSRVENLRVQESAIVTIPRLETKSEWTPNEVHRLDRIKARFQTIL